MERMNMKRYKMPDGTTRQFREEDAPACAILLEDIKAIKPAATKAIEPEEIENKEAPEPENKAVKAPKNKSKKGSKK